MHTIATRSRSVIPQSENDIFRQYALFILQNESTEHPQAWFLHNEKSGLGPSDRDTVVLIIHVLFGKRTQANNWLK